MAKYTNISIRQTHKFYLSRILKLIEVHSFGWTNEDIRKINEKLEQYKSKR